MILSRLSAYLKQRKRASVADMALVLDAQPNAVNGMLAALERKGRVRRLPAGSSCGSTCSKCDPTTLELYEWVGD